MRPCSRSMNRLTTWSIVVGAACTAGAAAGCAACADGSTEVCAGAELAGCDACALWDTVCADESAACCAAALNEPSRAAVMIQFEVRMSLSPGHNDPTTLVHCSRIDL